MSLQFYSLQSSFVYPSLIFTNQNRFQMGQYVSSHGDVISHVNITSVRVTDGGLYECAAHNDAGTTAHAARLNIYGRPTIRQMGQLTAVAGEVFRVTCPVGGYPIDKISWMKGGIGLVESRDIYGILFLFVVTSWQE